MSCTEQQCYPAHSSPQARNSRSTLIRSPGKCLMTPYKRLKGRAAAQTTGLCSRWLQRPCIARRASRGRQTRALALDTRAMVNVDFSPALLLGMSLIAGGLALYQLRRVQPDISRDFDVIVSAVATFSGGILIFQVGYGIPVSSSQVCLPACWTLQKRGW